MTVPTAVAEATAVFVAEVADVDAADVDAADVDTGAVPERTADQVIALPSGV